MLRAFVVTVSDKGYRGQREDTAGPLACELLRAAGYEVAGLSVVPDEQPMIEAELIRLADVCRAALVVTTGGTGFAPRDVTPEATAGICTRMAPGIPEAMRAYSLKLTDRAMLSRAAAGIRGQTLIVNLPGSPKAVKENLSAVLPALSHGLAMLLETEHECAAKKD